MKSLFDQTQFAGMKLKNRMFRSATYDGLADESGHMTGLTFNSHIYHYKKGEEIMGS